MRSRVLILTLVSLNLAFAGAWLISRSRNTARNPGSEKSAEIIPTSQVKIIPVYRKQFFSWQEVESDDYPTYIKNLRDIGCPEQTLRDIIIADVNELYARKKATEVVTVNQQWWRTEPDTNVITTAAGKIRALEEERRALLNRLLGPNWENSELAAATPKVRANVTLDGPVLGALPDSVKESVQQINAHGQERIQAYIEAQRSAGKTPDPAELARLRQQIRNELASVLSASQLEEFLLRYSENGNNLRKELGRLGYFNTTADEFRNIFRATDQIDQQLQALAGRDDPSGLRLRKALEAQREAAMKNALGPARYAEFLHLQDPAYRDAYAIGLQFNAPDSVQTFYEINQAVAQEKSSVNANTNLTAEQKAIELKRIELEQLKAQAEAAGQQLPASEQPPPPPPPPPKHPHTVRPGESIDAVASFYGVSVNAIRDANPGVDFSKLKTGDTVFVPGSLPVR